MDTRNLIICQSRIQPAHVKTSVTPPPFQRIHMICCYEIIHMHTCIRPMHTYRFFFLEEDLPVKRILRIYIKMVINEIWNIPVIMHINENLLNEMNIDFKKRDLDHAALLMFNGWIPPDTERTNTQNTSRCNNNNSSVTQFHLYLCQFIKYTTTSRKGLSRA